MKDFRNFKDEWDNTYPVRTIQSTLIYKRIVRIPMKRLKRSQSSSLPRRSSPLLQQRNHESNQLLLPRTPNKPPRQKRKKRAFERGKTRKLQKDQSPKKPRKSLINAPKPIREELERENLAPRVTRCSIS